MGSEPLSARGATPNKSQPVQTLGVRTPVEIMLNEPALGNTPPAPSKPCNCLASVAHHEGDCEWEDGNQAFYALAAERDRLRAENGNLRAMLKRAGITLSTEEFLASLDDDLDRADAELAAGETVSLAEVVQVLYEVGDEEMGDYIAERFGGDS